METTTKKAVLVDVYVGSTSEYEPGEYFHYEVSPSKKEFFQSFLEEKELFESLFSEYKGAFMDFLKLDDLEDYYSEEELKKDFFDFYYTIEEVEIKDEEDEDESLELWSPAFGAGKKRLRNKERLK